MFSIENLSFSRLAKFLRYICIGQAQPNNKYLTGTSIPAPTAGSLGKYGDIPVSYHTGVPNIDIPIYNVEEGPLSISIGLNYHASGIRVAETASWVGMGWSLNAGGVITRTVQGIPDETYPFGYYHYGNQIPTNTSSQAFIEHMFECNAGNRDAEPDLFTFNVGGYTGKFYIDYNGANPVYQFVPRQDLKLEFTSDFTKFTIIAPDGTRYTFGESTYNGTLETAREYTNQFGQPGSKKHCTSWYLSQVSTMDEKFKINLLYDNENYAYKNLQPCTQVEMMSGCPYPPYNNANPVGPQCSGAGLDQNHYYITTEIEGKRLKSIKYSTGEVIFSATVDRQDLDAHNQLLMGAKRLEKITINTGTPTNFCKEFVFEYDYFSDPAKASETFGKRLRLLRLQEKDCSTANPILFPKHTFDYNGNFLPYRLSKATDHWGFYNGATNNDNLWVSVPPTEVSSIGTNQIVTFGSANKETNENEMKKGVLTAINYPTGGKTTFDFEANRVYTNLMTTPITKLTQQSCLNTPANCCGTQMLQSSNVSFTAAELLNPSTTRFKLQLWPIRTNNAGQSTPCNNAVTAVGKVQAFRASDNAPVGNEFSFNVDATQSTGSVTQNLNVLQGSLTFTAGVNYYFKVTTKDAYGTLTITSMPEIYENKTVGGLRIKEIRSSESSTPSSNDIVKTYSYVLPNSTNSSGVLYRKPVYGFSNEPITMAGSDGSQILLLRIFFSESTLLPLFHFNGAHMGYSEVKESFNGNGHKIYKYLTGIVATPMADAFLLTPTYNDVFQGQPVSDHTYNASSTLVAENKQSGSETAIQLSSRQVYKVGSITLTCSGQSPIVPPPTFPLIITGYRGYFMRSSVYQVTQQITTIDGISDTTNSSYDLANRFVTFPTAIQKRNSDGKIYTTEFKYPHDMPAGCFKDFLLQKNIIGTPWKTIEKVGNTQVRGSEIAYASFNLATGAFVNATSCNPPLTVVRPYKFYNFEMTYVGGSPSTFGNDLRGTIDSYDANGLPTSFTSTNWAAETYSWSSSGLLQSKSYNGYTTTYGYHAGTRLISKITQPDGQEAWFDYDQFSRLTKTWARPSTAGTKTSANIITEIDYRYATQVTPTVNPYSKNFISTKNTFAAAPTGGGTSGLTTMESIQFLDGLGRPFQIVNRKQSPAQKDVVLATEYDKWGRVSKTFNPVESTLNTGDPLSSIPVGTPFSLTEYFADPLNRIWKTTPPSWYATTMAYGTNLATEVRLNHTSNTFYPANSLSKSTVTDPDNKQVITYKDKKGRTIMVRRTNTANAGPADTYYIYDDKDRTNKVIPPGSTFASTTLNFEYTYDQSDNMLTKKIPDAASVSMKYNNRDQLVLSQDGNLLAQNKWMCTQYDDFGRVIKTGLFSGTIPNPITPTLTPNDLYTETQYGTSGIQLGKVTKNKTKAFDTGGTWLETNTTYDAFGRPGTTTGNNYLLTTDLNAESITFVYDFADNVLKDTRVSKKTASASTTITQTHNYDHWGRNTLNTHQVGTGTIHNISQLNYDWKNQLKERNIGKSATAADYLQSLDYDYNDMGWLKTINPGMGGTNIGFPACPTVQGMPNPGAASSTPDQNDLFYLELKYDQLQTNLTGTANKNGNISQVIWRTRGRERQAYSLSYDYLNRMTAARYDNLNDAGTAVNNTNAWNENLTYDVRGNITALTRTGKYKATPTATCWTDGQIDNLAYTYNTNTNRLQKIADSAPTVSKTQGWNNTAGAATTAQYAYDANGNMTSDPYKGMTVTYNFMNLPTKFTFTGNKVIDVLYDGGGRKLRKTVTDNGVLQYRQDYVGGIEYRTTSTVTLSMESIYHAEGRVASTDDGTRYEYAVRDHLGNTRLTFTDKNGNGKVDVTATASSNEILQENHYYPFGMAMNGPWMNDPARNMPYQYNGKELNDDFGLGLYDYGARWYDASVGRWWSIDPLAENSRRWNGYTYCYDNPLRFVDPDGMQATGDFYAVTNGKVSHVGSDGENDGKQYLVKDISDFSKNKKDLNKETTNSMVSSGTVKEISVNSTSDGLSEGENYQEMYNCGDGDDISSVRENSASLVLDTKDASLSLVRHNPKNNESNMAVNPEDKVVTGGDPNKLILASVHTHQAAKFFGRQFREAISQAGGDGKTASQSGRTVYSFDDEHVDKHVPSVSMNRATSISVDNIAPSQAAFNGSFSILRDALRTAAPKK